MGGTSASVFPGAGCGRKRSRPVAFTSSALTWSLFPSCPLISAFSKGATDPRFSAAPAVAIGTACYDIGQICSALDLFSRDVAAAVTTVLYFVISVVYGILLEWRWRGQTIGKRILGLRVLDIHGMRLQLSQIVLRNLLRFVDMLPAFYLVGGIACLFSRNAQRLGDLAVGGPFTGT